MTIDDKFTVYTWKYWLKLHWILNPGLVINELFLGQRIPKVTLQDKTASRCITNQNLYVPCPHCKTVHDSRIWSMEHGTAFKNWFGLYCPQCHNTIPCIMNVFSFLILVVSSPLWWWFRQSLKQIWKEKQSQRFSHIKEKNLDCPTNPNGWVKFGIRWGICMFVIITFVLPLTQNREIEISEVLRLLTYWLSMGFGVGLFIKHLMNQNQEES